MRKSLKTRVAGTDLCKGHCWFRCKQSSACRWGIAFVLAASLQACSTDSPQALLDNYITRMERVLETPIVVGNARDNVLLFPRPRDLRVEQQEISIGLIDFFSLKDCELQKVVAGANDSLGRVAQPSTQLVLHLNFLRHAPVCIERMASNGESGLAETLQRAHSSKLEQLPFAIWMAIVGGEEYRAFWRKPNRLFDYPTQAFTQADRALVSLTQKSRRWLTGDYRVDAAALESDLQSLSSGDGGSLLKSLMLQHNALSTVDLAIKQRLSEKPLCHYPAAARGQILDNVVRKFFIADVQAWAARLESRRFKLLPKTDALENLLSSAEPKAFSVWRAQRDELISHYALAPKRHADALLPLLQQCGKAPGMPS
ncbi:MAG: DUF3080 family protein [Pseudomonadota bacterium]